MNRAPVHHGAPFSDRGAGALRYSQKDRTDGLLTTSARFPSHSRAGQAGPPEHLGRRQVPVAAVAGRSITHSMAIVQLAETRGEPLKTSAGRCFWGRNGECIQHPCAIAGLLKGEDQRVLHRAELSSHIIRLGYPVIDGNDHQSLVMGHNVYVELAARHRDPLAFGNRGVAIAPPQSGFGLAGSASDLPARAPGDRTISERDPHRDVVAVGQRGPEVRRS